MTQAVVELGGATLAARLEKECQRQRDVTQAGTLSWRLMRSNAQDAAAAQVASLPAPSAMDSRPDQ